MGGWLIQGFLIFDREITVVAVLLFELFDIPLHR